MKMYFFRQALRLAEEYSHHVTLGGGEPTIHPRFREMLIESMAAENCEGVHVITNGTHKANALLLAKLCKAEVIGAELSWDQYHDQAMVHPEVYDAFLNPGPNSGGGQPTALRSSADKGVSAVGSADENCLSQEYYCVCPDLIVRPNGEVMACACPDAPSFGNFMDGINIPEWYQGDCWRESWEGYYGEEAPVTYRPSSQREEVF